MRDACACDMHGPAKVSADFPRIGTMPAPAEVVGRDTFRNFFEAAVTLNGTNLPSYSLVGFALFITGGTGNGQQARITRPTIPPW
jgi:hypothetical protein